MATAKRRKRGTGSIYPHKDGVRAQIRLTDERGKSHTFTKILDSEPLAEDWLSEKINLQTGGSIIDRSVATDGLTVKSFLRIWLDHKYVQATGGSNLKRISVETVQAYEGFILHHVLPTLGDKKLKEVSRADLRNWTHVMDKTKTMRTNQPVSASTKHRVTVVLKQAFKYALSHGYIEKNPLIQVDLFTAPAQRISDRPMTDKDYLLFTNFISEKKCDHQNDYCQLRWNFALTTTKRQGEVLSLKWDDIDFNKKNPTVTIRTHIKQTKAQHGCGDVDENGVYPCGKKIAGYCNKRIGGSIQRFDGTKTGQGDAQVIPLVPSLVEQFQIHKKAQDADIALAKKNGTISPTLKSDGWAGLVFSRPRNQRVVLLSDDYARFVEICKEAGLSKHYRVHDLRHTGVSRIVSRSGGNIGIAQTIAGHKTIQTTQLYTSPDLKSQLDAMKQALS